MGFLGWIRYGGSTPHERTLEYGCDGCRPDSANAYYRAVSVNAPAQLAYRWLCQLRLAPYSYDLIDNRGRRSPRELTPGADSLKAGDEFLVFETTRVDPGREITGRGLPAAERAFGPMAGTYAIMPRPDGTSRIVVKLWLGATGRFGRLKRAALVAGDAVMMRKQLTTIGGLAERDQRRAAGLPVQTEFTLIQRAFAIFVALHALVHLIGFAVPWKLATLGDIAYKTTAFGGSVELGDAGVKAIGLAWLAVTGFMLVAALMLWRGSRWAREVTIAAAAASFVLCAAGLPDAARGLAIDVVLAGLLAARPWAFVGRRAGA